MSQFDYRVLSYVAGLEFALDRLRKQSGFLRHEAVDVARQIETLCNEATAGSPTALETIRSTATDFTELLQDLDEPAVAADLPDRVTHIAFRPLVKSVFRRHQRFLKCPNVELRLELGCEQIVWFPGRLRHILENLIGNALKDYDPSKGEGRVQISLRSSEEGYELRVSDNGVGLTRDARATLFELFDRARPNHLADPVVELAVLKLIVEQTGGTLSVESTPGQGASFVAILPRFEMNDFLT